MMQVISQTRDEKIAMYEKLEKRELIEMLLNNIELLSNLSRQQTPIYYMPSHPMGRVCPAGVVCSNAFCPRNPDSFKVT